MALVITSKSFCFVAGRPCSTGDIEQLLAAIIGLGLLVWVTQDAKGKPLAEQLGALLRGLRDVEFLIPVPFALWYDSLHPNVTVRVFAIALVLTEVQDVVRRRQAQRTTPGRPKKPISAMKAAEGYSLIVDPRKDGGYVGWSVEDDNLKVAAPSLLGIDEATRNYIREGLGGGPPLELTLGTSGTMPSGQRPRRRPIFRLGGRAVRQRASTSRFASQRARATSPRGSRTFGYRRRRLTSWHPQPGPKSAVGGIMRPAETCPRSRSRGCAKRKSDR